MYQTLRFSELVAALILALGLGSLSQVSAQPANGNPSAKLETRSDIKVLTRGPVHEAFIEQVNLNPNVGLVVPKAVPNAVDEIPPALKPAGANVTWIPGYWGWDDISKDFIWISGVWRVPPPGMRWVPGYWKKSESGSQWTAGFWIRADVKQVAYRQYPAKSLERGASSNAPSPNHFYVSGAWEASGGKDKWRPGYWAPQQANFVWVPAHYSWTPSGAVFVGGYWDYSVAARGQLFAPVSLTASTAAATTAKLKYSPVAAIANSQLLMHLWVRPGYNHYYFGDYYGAAAELGIRPWYTAEAGFDPLFPYYAWHYGRGGVDYLARMVGWHDYFVSHVNLRPAHTLDAQLAFVKAHADDAHLAQSVLAVPLADLAKTADFATNFVQLGVAQRLDIATSALGVNTLAAQRLKLEGLAAPGLVLDGALSETVKLPAQALALPVLPGVQLPGVGTNVGVGVGSAVQNLRLPANPKDLIDVKPIVPVEPPVDLPDLPLLPF